MMRSLNSGVSGIQQFQTSMDVIGNNIANVNTVGFKSARISFADAFSQSLRPAAPGSGNTSATPAMQVGTGVTTAAIKNTFLQGALTRTGVATDLGISGEGFFLVRDSLSGATYATRAGDFRLDQNGYLVTNQGLRVQGYADSGLTTLGDIQINATGAPATASPTAVVENFAVDAEGRITVRLSDGTQFVRGQILLQRFQDPQVLTKEGNNLYANLAAAGPLAQPAAPGTQGLGRVEAGALELSNVDLSNEFAQLITTQRAFQANARIISSSDELLSELVNLKR
ncbi:flagellar hook-basal body complex protein [Fontisphaera persica]|uniref:flagellar hook-basal body protein n=1 Tax=Fontisphaera persica TaxID=2974023 RepID=UPI0024BF79B5|nr:flagellar hook-basal body complex protein [Fontisphaera persica]WCJ58222.1 flagellar hook-basal body complex protein [Fontisphaera persica]